MKMIPRQFITPQEEEIARGVCRQIYLQSEIVGVDNSYGIETGMLCVTPFANSFLKPAV